MGMKRRAFIKKCGLSAIAAAGVISGCKSENSRTVPATSVTYENNEMLISKDEFVTQSFVQVDHPSLSQPIGVFKIGDEDYAASLMSCTHQKCTTVAVDLAYVCPCHGAKFSNTGKVLKGPAEKDLTTYPTRTEGGFIFITLK